MASSALQTFMEPAAVGRGAFLPSLVAVWRSQKEPRAHATVRPMYHRCVIPVPLEMKMSTTGT